MHRSDPDALTPREQQVLDLLKRGYSNRDIAKELQISLSGAKYHVSEIISKLGVSSRDEAAGWTQEGSRRWILVPALFSQRRGLLPAGLTLKLTLGLGAASALAIAAIVVTGGAGVGTDDAPLAAAQPTPTPDFPCPDPGESCVRILHVELASWDEAADITQARLLEPTYLPAGFERDRLTYSYSDPPTERVGVYTSVVSADFLDAKDVRLIVNQGFGPSLQNYAYHMAPDEYRGSLVVNGAQLYWVNGNPVWEQRADGGHATDEWALDSLDNYTLTWEESRTGSIAWEKSPEGDVTYHRTGNAVAYLIHSTGLPLEELIKVAESMLQD